MSDLQRAHLVEAARAFVGTPYQYNGTGREGIDCRALIVEAHNSVFHETPIAHAAYGDLLDIATIVRELASRCDRVLTGIPGDIAILEHGGLFHLAIYTGSHVIHASLFEKQVCETLIDSRIRVRSFWRFKEL